MELGMCWRCARYGVGALLELRVGVRSWGLSWIEMELGLEAGLVGNVGLVMNVQVQGVGVGMVLGIG